MTMTKQHFKAFADAFALIENEETREQVIKATMPVLRSSNWRFDEGRFREWIKRRVNGESTKGLG